MPGDESCGYRSSLPAFQETPSFATLARTRFAFLCICIQYDNTQETICQYYQSILVLVHVKSKLFRLKPLLLL